MSSSDSPYLETAKHAAIFGLGSVLNKAAAFVLLPLYTSYLSTADYGVLAILNAGSMLLGLVLQMGMGTSVFKKYFSVADLHQRRLATSTLFFWLAAVAGVSMVAFWQLGEAASLLLFGAGIYANHCRLVCVTAALSLFQLVPFALFRAQKRSRLYVAFSVGNFMVGTLFCILFVVFYGQGVLGVLRAQLINAAIFALVGAFLCRQDIAFRFSRRTLKELLMFGLPLVPSAIGSYLLSQGDRYFLQHFSTKSQIGIYSLGYTFGGLVNILCVQPFQLIWLPTAFEIVHKESAKKFFERMLPYFLVAASWLALGLSLLGREVIGVMTSGGFHPAYLIVPWIAYSYVVYGAYMVVNIGIYLKGKTSYSVWIVGSAAISNLLLNAVLIPRLDITGAAISTFASYGVLLGVSWVINRRLYPLSYDWTGTLKLGGVVGLLLIAGNLTPNSVVVAVLVKLLLLAAFWPLLVITGFFSRDEVAAGLGALERLRGKLARPVSGRSVAS